MTNGKPADGLMDFKRFGDWTSWSSVLVLVALLPVTVVCLSPFAAIAGEILPGDFITWIVVYFAGLVVVLIPGLGFLQIWLIARGSRLPTSEELDRLTPAWEDVLSRVGKGSNRRYQLRVLDDPYNLNAFAGGGCVVMITTRSLWYLPEDQLRAVLAHELGHHAGMHPVVLLAQAWMYRPIAAFAWLTATVHNLLARISQSITSPIFFLVALLIFALRMLLYILGMIVRIADLILLFFGRRAEYRADGMAVSLGYGNSLIAALLTIECEHPEELVQQATGSLLADLKKTHPPIPRRVQRIQEAMT